MERKEQGSRPEKGHQAGPFGHYRWEKDAEDGLWTKRFLVLLGALFAFRVFYLAVFPFGLVGDEAYYWDWGRQLSWGYYSKPPLIAWLMALASATTGASEFGLRIWAVLLGSGSLALLFVSARRLFGAKTAFWAAVLMAASTGNAALNLILTIDAPLIFFWSFAFYSLMCWLQHDSGRPSWAPLPLAGLLLALGLGNLSKQMMLVFPLLVVVSLASHRDSRRFLVHPALWTVFLLSLLFLIPPLWWNSQHEWITVQHTGDHFESGQASVVDALSRFLAFFAAQMAVISPVTWILAVFVLVGTAMKWPVADARVRLLTLFSLPALAVFSMMAVRQPINPNWPAVYYPTALILVAAWTLGRWEAAAVPGRLRRWLGPAVGSGFTLAAITYAAPFVVQWSGFQGTQWDPFVRLSRYEKLAVALDDMRDRLEPAHGDLQVLTLGHRYLACQMAFYLDDQPRVYRFEPTGTVQSQYELWSGLPEGATALIVANDKAEGQEVYENAKLRASFEQFVELPVLEVELSPQKTARYPMAVGLGWRGAEVPVAK